MGMGWKKETEKAKRWVTMWLMPKKMVIMTPKG